MCAHRLRTALAARIAARPTCCCSSSVRAARRWAYADSDRPLVPARADLTNGGATLPAHPVRAACAHLADAALADEDSEEALLEALGKAAMTLYDPDASAACVELPTDVTYDGIWDYQYCTELLPQETYFARDGNAETSPWRGQRRGCRRRLLLLYLRALRCPGLAISLSAHCPS